MSFIMALLVSLSTLSFTVDKHFCGNTLVDVAFFTEAEGCGMEIASDVENPCCKDQVDLIQGQNELKYSFNDFNLDKHQFVTAFFISYVNLFEGLPEQVIPFKEYSPPNLIYDRRVLHNVFII